MKPIKLGPMRDGAFKLLFSLYLGLPRLIEVEVHVKRCARPGEKINEHERFYG